MTAFFTRRRLTAIALVAACAACSSSSSTDEGARETQNYRIRTGTIDKVDLLLAVDNSFSMTDKQALLAQAIPDLLGRLLKPRCLDVLGEPTGASADDAGKCPTGKPEFAPVQDIHVGVISSSLGSLGGTVCTELPQDDRAHLLTRVTEGKPAPRTQPGQFLTWLPDTQENRDKGKRPLEGATPEPTANALAEDSANLLLGAGSRGCGFEAQLESAYRFLVQPDPYDRVERDGEGMALRGVDRELLKQRRDFLRPDSLVAVIVLTDENESSADPRAASGYAWRFQSADSMYGGTTACATDANAPDCASCMQKEARSRPECQNPLSREQDAISLRFFEPKRRFGLDPRYPIERYVRGLREPRVPNRDGEHPANSTAYVGDANCTNPLYASDLPGEVPDDLTKLCNLPRGPRTPDMVVFTLIGGVPWQLLTTDPANFKGNTAPFKKALDDADWKRILGTDPFHYDFAGIDPHMRESIAKREGLALPDDALPREWDTRNNDLQYACTFPLPAPRDCSVPDRTGGCDCVNDEGVPSDSSLCDPASPSTQLRGKAYPTVTELAVAKALGPQAVVASLCPRTLDAKSPDYGYRPAVSALAARVKSSLNGVPCLPTALTVQENGKVACQLLELLPAGDPATACDLNKGLEQPESAVLARFRERQKADGADEASRARPVCVVKQLTPEDRVGGSCERSAATGWCYVTREDDPESTCSQSIRFSVAGVPPAGSLVELQCAAP